MNTVEQPAPATFPMAAEDPAPFLAFEEREIALLTALQERMRLHPSFPAPLLHPLSRMRSAPGAGGVSEAGVPISPASAPMRWEPMWFIGAYPRYLCSLLPEIPALVGEDPETALATACAVLKLALLHLGIALDTHLDADQRALLEMKDYAQKIVTSVPVGLLILSPDQRVVSANPAFLKTFGLRREEVVGRRIREILPLDGLPARIDRLLRKRATRDDLFAPLIGLDDERMIRVALSSMRSLDEDEARVLLVVEDFTEVARLRAAAAASEQRYSDLVAELDAIVWEADPHSLRFSFVSCRAEELLGYSLQRWLQDPDFWARHVHPEDREWALACVRAAAGSRGEHSFEYRSVSSDGRVLWLRNTVRAVWNPPGQCSHLRGVITDITGRKATEEALQQRDEQLRQAQKLEAIGRLAAGVAHDFNNMLAVITGYSELLLDRVPSGDPLRRGLEGISDAATRSAALTRQLLAFGRQQVLAPQVLDLNVILQAMEQLLRDLVGRAIQVEVSLHSGLGSVRADPSQVEQVMVNLAVNARDAMPRGGRLMIHTRDVVLEGGPTPGEALVPPGEYVLLIVGDTGEGMDSETASRIFEPFFTTRPPGQGTGLGLSTVYGIVQQSGGHISVESEPGQGTWFRIYLPRVAQPARPVPAEDAPRAPDGGSETILLVENEHGLRHPIGEILRKQGYRVLDAGCAEEALGLFEVDLEGVDLVLTDVVMPGMGGLELGERVRAGSSGTAVLFMSGLADDATLQRRVERMGALFIQKPFSGSVLLQKVREALDQKRAHRPGRTRAPGTCDC